MSSIVENEGTYDCPMMPLDNSIQTSKTLKPELFINEFAQVPTKRSKIQFHEAIEIKKIPSEKKEHQSLLKLKKQIRNLIDFQSMRIALKDIPTNDFSKNIQISKNFQLITLDGEPVPELMLCKKCFQVRARGRLSSTPIVRHLKQHDKVEKSRMVEQKKKAKKTRYDVVYAASLTQAMKNSIPITKIGQECGENLAPEQRHGVMEMVLRKGEHEEQITLCKNLERNLWNKFHLEKSEQKRKEMSKELRYLESISGAVKSHTWEKNPQLANSMSSRISLGATEDTLSRKSKENVIAITISEANNTASSLRLGVREISEVCGTETISSDYIANKEAEKSPMVIAENDIKLEISND